MRIYMVRHGETIFNKKGCYYGRTDAVLSLRGRQQAQSLREYFRNIPLEYVVTSPLCRAVETAQIIMAGHAEERNQRRNIKLYEEQRLFEHDFGVFEGYTYQELLNKYPNELANWNQDYYHYRIPGGESFMDVRKRTESFFDDLKKHAEQASREKTILLVAHKGTLGHLLAVSLGLPPEGYWNFTIEQGCYSRMDLEDGYAIIRCLNKSVK